MLKLNTHSIIKTAVYGLAAFSFVELSTSYFIPEWIRYNSACYKDAMKSLRQHPKAVELLGEPIKEGRIRISDSDENNADMDMFWFIVPVEGPKSSGKMRYWIDSAEKSSERMFRVVRIELQCNNLPNDVLVVEHVRE